MCCGVTVILQCNGGHLLMGFYGCHLLGIYQQKTVDQISILCIADSIQPIWLLTITFVQYSLKLIL